jgi:F-type H+-transporting ATPase subunit b
MTLAVLVVSLTLGFLCAGPTRAADAAKDSHSEKAGDSHSQGRTGEGGSDLSMFGFENFLDLAIWTWIVFLLLFWILRRYAWKPMLEGLKKREQNIAQAIEDAEKARQETRELQATLQARINEASAKVAEMLAEGRRDVEALRQQMMADTQAEIHKERERLHREIGLARDQALQELWHHTAQLATLISSKAIRRHLSVEDHRRLVDEALAEFREAGKEHQRQIASVQRQ